MAVKIPLVLNTDGQIEQLQPGDTVAGGSGTLITKGTTTIDFGTFPGNYDASVIITGQAGILISSFIIVQISPIATADHSADEHLMVMETIKLIPTSIVAATGFTIYGFDISKSEPSTPVRLSRFSGTGQDAGAGQIKGITSQALTPKLYGQFTVAWSWWN